MHSIASIKEVLVGERYFRRKTPAEQEFPSILFREFIQLSASQGERRHRSRTLEEAVDAA